MMSRFMASSASVRKHGERTFAESVIERDDERGALKANGPNPLENDNWTALLPSTDHIRFFRSRDWGSTTLGPLSTWSSALRIHTFSLLADSRPSCIYWGPNKIAIYNAAFVPLFGNVHPNLMGTSFGDNFPEVADEFAAIFETAEATGLAADVKEVPFFVQRAGFAEEAYFTGNFNPLRGNTGKVEGFYNSVADVTKAKVAERRRATLNRLQVPSALRTANFASCVIPFLEPNERDIPMALLYEVDEEEEPGRCLLLLKGHIGIPKGHGLLVQRSEIHGSRGIIPFLKKEKDLDIVPINERFDGVEWRGFGEPSTNVSVLRLSGAGRLFGFLVVGNNPRGVIDEEHTQFMKELSAAVSSIAASLVSTDEARRRAERLERELADSEKQIRYMAQNASVGMQHLAVDGTMMWANDQYYNLTGHSRDEKSAFSFIDVFATSDQSKAFDAFNRLIQGEPNISVELHLKKLFTPPSGDPAPACILSLSFPFSENGNVKSIMTCITDVSSLKWAESSEARNAADAREAKRQQEEFIDLVSHELRNPLSAIFQLADTIITSFPPTQIDGPGDFSLSQALKNNIEAANTILMCAKHQKRIVDDVLTLSKLEYTMLSVSPSPVQLPVLIGRSVKMFDADTLDAKIKVTVVGEPSLQRNNVDWILCDPSRVTQILINLLTNAIKFTKNETKREISIKYGAQLSNPRDKFPAEMQWAPNQKEMDDLTLESEWGTGEPLFLTVSVSDTGVGMTLDHIKNLFSRFQQASAKTSIKYGGSGLGLFISQRLTQKQGGEIGVMSELGQGSTFVFYVKARRAETGPGSPPASTSRPSAPRSISSPAVVEFPETDFDNIHVLLVEDNHVNQQVLRRQLTMAGCVVSVANHGVEALEELRATDAWRDKAVEGRHIDIILMDWEMPIMDGLTASKEIRALEKSGDITRRIEIIATTANAREEQVQAALASGIDCVMSKPFMVTDLMEKMRERLRAVGKRNKGRGWVSP